MLLALVGAAASPNGIAPSGVAEATRAEVAKRPAAVAAGCGTAKRYPATARSGLPGRPPLAIGDSVLLGAAKNVAAVGYEVDVRGCRMYAEGLALLRARARARTLPRLVVIALGTNATISERDLRTARTPSPSPRPPTSTWVASR